MLLVLSVTALVRVGTGNHPAGSITPAWGWFNPLQGGFTGFVTGIILMLFIYWGWDTAVAVNEETKDPAKTPGRAAILSTVILLVTYVIVILAAQSFAGVGTTGSGSATATTRATCSPCSAGAVFGGSGFGVFLARLLILMVLTSAAASTQTTILPTARTTLSMATYKALPKSFAKMHPRYLTPTVSTIVMGVVSAVLYLAFNYVSQGFVIADAVTAIGLYIAFYYGLTGFACAWYYRKTLLNRQRNLWMQGILPVLGGLIMYAAGGWSIWADWDVASEQQLHVLADAVLAALVHRRRVRDRLPLGARRADRRDLDQVRPAGVLPQADPHQGHPDPRARRIAGGENARPRTHLGTGPRVCVRRDYSLSRTDLSMPGVLAEGSACRQTSSITSR